MEILKKGNLEKKEWIGYCRVCNAIAKCKTDELNNIQIGDYRSDNEDFAWENCPFCKKERTMIFYQENSNSLKQLLKNNMEKIDGYQP